MRPIMVSIILLLVLSVGLPLEPVSSIAYEILSPIGIEVSMAPLTYDTSIMLDRDHTPIYQKDLKLTIVDKEGERKIPLRILDIYRHKIPVHLYYEIIGWGGSMNEGLHYMCQSLRYFSRGSIIGFHLSTGSPRDEEMGFNELQKCP